MKKYRTSVFYIGILFVCCVSVNEGAAGTEQRSKRQAPNINVHQIPKTSFTCDGRKQGDYYADPEANCQVYHVCVPGMYNRMTLISFVCPNGTIFSQASRVCTPYDRVDCKLATKFYESVHGNFNNGGPGYDADSDFDNYVPQPPRAAAPPPPRAQSPRQQPPPQSSRNTIPPPQPQEAPAQPQRNPSRFRTSTSQFRPPQSRPAQAPPQPATAAPPPPPPPPAARPPVRAVVPAIRPPVPVPGARPAPAIVRPAVLPTTTPSARPTVRAVVSTSTSAINYEYEYEYDYEDETPEQPAVAGRRKRDASAAYIDYYEGREDLDLEREPKDTKFTCKDKVAGGVYSDIETDCEMFHICVPLSKSKMVDYKLYCANGKAFDQETGTCKEKSEFKCEKAESFYLFDKLNQSMLGKKPIYKKSSYTKSKKSSMSHKE